MATLLFFGRLQDVVSAPNKNFQVPEDVETTEALRKHLDVLWGLKGALCEKTIRVAVNGELAAPSLPVSNDDEIAFMPPVGGG